MGRVCLMIVSNIPPPSERSSRRLSGKPLNGPRRRYSNGMGCDEESENQVEATALSREHARGTQHLSCRSGRQAW